MTTEIICYVGKCTRLAMWRVENGETGKIWFMCDQHMHGFNRKPLIVQGRI